jgi:hypothetical protein
VTTVGSLAQLDLSVKTKIDGIGSAALLRIREQARLQVEGREAGHPVYELLETTEPSTGHWRIPAREGYGTFCGTPPIWDLAARVTGIEGRPLGMERPIMACPKCAEPRNKRPELWLTLDANAGLSS